MHGSNRGVSCKDFCFTQCLTDTNSSASPSNLYKHVCFIQHLVHGSNSGVCCKHFCFAQRLIHHYLGQAFRREMTTGCHVMLMEFPVAVPQKVRMLKSFRTGFAPFLAPITFTRTLLSSRLKGSASGWETGMMMTWGGWGGGWERGRDGGRVACNDQRK